MDAGLRNEHASVILNNVVKLHITRKEEETMTQKKFSTKYLVEMALLVAIILIMAFTPIGYIRTAGLEITLIVVPVAVGAVTLGPGGRRNLRRRVRCYKFHPVLRHEPIWCCTAWNQRIFNIFSMRTYPYFNGMADRSDL